MQVTNTPIHWPGLSSSNNSSFLMLSRIDIAKGFFFFFFFFLMIDDVTSGKIRKHDKISSFHSRHNCCLEIR